MQANILKEIVRLIVLSQKPICSRRCNNDPRAEAERFAINAPIQGGAADIIKKAMLNISQKLQDHKLQSKIVSQIHDELLIEAPESEVEQVKKLLVSAMEDVNLLPMKLKVDVEVGKTWN